MAAGETQPPREVPRMGVGRMDLLVRRQGRTRMSILPAPPVWPSLASPSPASPRPGARSARRGQGAALVSQVAFVEVALSHDTREDLATPRGCLGSPRRAGGPDSLGEPHRIARLPRAAGCPRRTLE